MRTEFEIKEDIRKLQQELNMVVNGEVFVEKICKSQANIIDVIVENKYKNMSKIPQNNSVTYKIKGIKKQYKVVCEITSLNGEVLGRGCSFVDEYKDDICKGWLLAQHRANIDWRCKSIKLTREY